MGLRSIYKESWELREKELTDLAVVVFDSEEKIEAAGPPACRSLPIVANSESFMREMEKLSPTLNFDSNPAGIPFLVKRFK